MNITIAYIRERFDYFNRLCFEGKLPALPIKLSSAKRFLGAIQFKSRVNDKGEWKYYDFVLKISTRLDLSEAVVEDTILHELIHYYIYVNGIADTSTHGEVFQRMMNDINQRFNRHITISHHSTEEQRNTDQHIAPHIVCVSELTDGRRGITVCARTRIFEIYRDLLRRYPIKQLRWFFTTDPYFNRFPRCTSAKVFLPKETDFMEKLETAVQLECDGTTMRRK